MGTAQPRRGDTRRRIQEVALELFLERGYEGTSLREIAEHLDVTKAALYYHFKNKEDIVLSLLDTYVESVDALIEWVRQQDRTPEIREQALVRWTAVVQTEGVVMMRFVQKNEHIIQSLKTDRGHFGSRLAALFEVIDDPSLTPEQRLRMRLAFLATHMAMLAGRDMKVTDADLLQISTNIAQELLRSATQ
jgi:AcrR family transcriptional regulator